MWFSVMGIVFPQVKLLCCFSCPLLIIFALPYMSRERGSKAHFAVSLSPEEPHVLTVVGFWISWLEVLPPEDTGLDGAHTAPETAWVCSLAALQPSVPSDIELL